MKRWSKLALSCEGIACFVSDEPAEGPRFDHRGVDAPMDRPSTLIWLEQWRCGPSPLPTPPPHDVCERGRQRRGREVNAGTEGGRAVGVRGVSGGEVLGWWGEVKEAGIQNGGGID